MNQQTAGSHPKLWLPFERIKKESAQRFHRLGTGNVGGKAQGLAFLEHLVQSKTFSDDLSPISVGVPNLTVLCTDVFDEFMEENDLVEVANSSVGDERIAHAFQQADLPFGILGDLRSLIEQTHTPLAIRSSSLLEDTTYSPFAGIYATKMIPNHQYEPRIRFQKAVEAIKYVYASTYFRSAKSYRVATKHDHDEEKMAVIIQNVVGKKHSLRFYPEISGVARSFNYYPVGHANPEDGVVNLALGLGKTIVDGGVTWTYSPAYPTIGPPFGSIKDLLDRTQIDFWVINLGTPLVYDPLRETEFLVLENISTAEKDGVLRKLCSTYDAQNDRLQMGMSSKGPRAVTFAPLLTLGEIHFNDALCAVLEICESEIKHPVEIEFAMTLEPNFLGLLQVRPMVVSSEQITIPERTASDHRIFVSSDRAFGNGSIDGIHDIVYVRPDAFDLNQTRQMALELSEINSMLVESERPYLLIVFGRLGTSDPWLGIPVQWGQISGTRAIVETYTESLRADMSQGSHFFHNMTSLQVGFLSVPRTGKSMIDWDWLEEQEEVYQTKYIRHVRLVKPLSIRIDGRSGKSVILK